MLFSYKALQSLKSNQQEAEANLLDMGNSSDPLFPDKRTSIQFSVEKSTHDLYLNPREQYQFYGPYAHIRRSLDYGYHCNYSKTRQWLQDSIIDKLLGEIVIGTEESETRHSESFQELKVDSSIHQKKTCTIPTKPWFVYIVGTRLSNRSGTIKALMKTKENGMSKFPLLGFVIVDSREVRDLLPEYHCYAREKGEIVAQKLTFREVGYISEIIVRAALEAGSNVLMLGGLRNPEWYATWFPMLRKDFHCVSIALLRIISTREERELPEECERIENGISTLQKCVQYYCKIRSVNDGEELKILTDGITWQSFLDNFTQLCAYIPEKIHTFRVEHRGEDGFIHIFSLDLSTEENYMTNSNLFYGPYRNFREKLDYTYHHNYKRERQILQDYIIKETLNMPEVVDATNGSICTTPTENFLVFTAGAMGAGKSYTLKWCHQRALFPLNAFVIVDPDEVRQQFPEYSLYVSQNPTRAGEMTRKEAGYIVEVLTLAALQAGKNVLVDGSLRDHVWYSEYFEKLRKNYPSLKIMILHIDAPRDAVFARAESRGKITGRIVPRETLELSLQQVPKSVDILKDKVDFYCKLYNAPCADGIQLLSDHLTWDSFKNTWLQTCAWVPKPPASKKLRQNSGN